MKKLSLIMGALLLATPAYADNIADCEIVMIEKIKEGEKTGAVIQSFAPATDVIASIYDDEDGHLTQLDGRDVKAILCQRRNVIPSLGDFPILATGIPFALSNNFESAESRSLTMFFKDDKFQHIFKGPDLSEEEKALLEETMEAFNLQPHDLGQKVEDETVDKAEVKDEDIDESKDKKEVDEEPIDEDIEGPAEEESEEKVEDKKDEE